MRPPLQPLTALVETLRGIPDHSAVVNAELCFPGPDSAHGSMPSTWRIRTARNSDRYHCSSAASIERLLSRAKVPCLHLVDAWLLEAAEQHGLEGVASKRRSAPYRSPFSTLPLRRVRRLVEGEYRELAAR